MKIRPKLLFTYIALGLVSMLLSGVVGYTTAKTSLIEATLKHLRLVAEGKEAEVFEYLESKKNRTLDSASGIFIRHEVDSINKLTDLAEYKKAAFALSNAIKVNRKPFDPDIVAIHILNPAGKIIASTDEKHIGSAEEKDQPYFFRGLEGTYIHEISIHETDSMKHEVITVSAPVKSPDGKRVTGVLVNFYDFTSVIDILTGKRNRLHGALSSAEGLIPSLEMLVVNRDRKIIASTSGTVAKLAEDQAISTEPVEKCLKNSEEINKEWVDYSGLHVLGASMCLQSGVGLRWVLIVKQIREQALDPVLKLRNITFAIAGFVLLAIFFVAWLVSDSIARPIRALHKGAEIIGSGNLDYRTGIDTRDEIGLLANAFDAMTGELKETYTSLEQEIGERKHAEEELRRLNQELEHRVRQLDTANRELEDFSYAVSHDLKTPLRAIDGFSNILFEDYSHVLNDEGKRLLNIIRDNERRMTRLIEDILSFLHFRSMEPKMTEVNMGELAKEVCDELGPLFAGRTVQFEIKSLHKAYGDKTMLRQVFVNLISNAVKFTRTRELAVIEIGNLKESAECGMRNAECGMRSAEYKQSGEDTGRTVHNEAIYYVKDNGVGFDMQYVNKLFGVFLRLHHAEEFEGNAVGLAIVKRIIEKHGGRVWAEGRVGEGATFYFSLPKPAGID